MPSIPQSLLWISLVVLWLFVLVPMLISKRDAVRRTSDVALATRVLNSGRNTRLLRRSKPAAGHASDPDWRPSEDDLDDDVDEEIEDAPTERSVVVAAAVIEDTEPEYLDVDVNEEAAGALPAGQSAAEVVVETDDVDEPVHQTDELPLDFDESAEEPVAEESQEEYAEELEEVEPEEEYDEAEASDDEYEYVADSSGLEAPSDTDLQLADSLSAARQRRHESKTSTAVGVRKFKFRKRMLTLMVASVVASAVAAYLQAAPGLWWVVRQHRRSDGALPGLSATSDADRGTPATPSRPARGPVAARRGEHPRPGVRRGAGTAAPAGICGVGDRRRGSDLRAPRLRAVRAALRPAARGGSVTPSVSAGAPRLVACATGTRGYGAVGSATRSHRVGQGFESP